MGLIEKEKGWEEEGREGREGKGREGGEILGFTFECVPFVGNHNYFFGK